MIKNPSGGKKKKKMCAPTKGRKRLVEVKVDYLEDPTGEFRLLKKKKGI